MTNDIPDESIVDIDEDILDKEWLKQPKLYMRYALLLAEAKHNLAQAKADVDVVSADIELQIRSTPLDFGISGKATEGAVHAVLVTQKKYKVAVKNLLEAQHRVDMLNAVLRALEHRKDTLENLVYLHGQNYFSTPRARGSKDIEETTKREARKVGTRKDRD